MGGWERPYRADPRTRDRADPGPSLGQGTGRGRSDNWKVDFKVDNGEFQRKVMFSV